MIKVKIFLALVLLLFAFTRLYKIAQIPSSVYWDEASIGYNAYSVLTTGRDEWGEFLPLHFRAFGEFKLPVYIYSVIPFIKIFGLNALSVRFPSVLFSFLTIIFVYLLARKMKISKVGSVFSAFFLATTPWLFIFSRAGYEATAGLLFFIVGIYFYLKSHDNKLWFLVSSLSFIVSVYSYNSFRILSPVIFLLLLSHYIFSNRKRIRDYITIIGLSIVIFLISLIPVARLYILDYGAARAQTVSLQGTAPEKILQFGKNYLSHFSPKFLFIKGDSNVRSQIPGFGQLYVFSLPFILLGIVKIVKDKRIEWYFVLFVFLLAPIPAAITRESPHALRSIAIVPLYALIAAYGLEYMLEIFKKYKNFIITLTTFVFLGFFINYLWNFFNIYPSISSEAWQYGYKAVNIEYKEEFPEYSTIYISDFYGQPYIFSLFYQVIDPEFFHNTVVYNPVDKWGKSTVARIDRELEYKIDLINQDDKNVLVFSAPEDNFKFGNITDEIRFPDGNVAFYVFKL